MSTADNNENETNENAITEVTLSSNDEEGSFLRYNGETSVVQKDKVTKVIVEEGVETLPDDCFEKCELLEEIQLPSTLTSIGGYCFWKCKKLKKIIIPDGVETLDDYCFHECELLEEIQLPSALTSIGRACFCSCNKLKKIIIPDGVEYIPYECFSRCDLLEEVELPPSITSLGWKCFEFCKKLQKIKIPENVETIGTGAFYECRSLKLTSIPESVESIGELAFYGCASLNQITIPSCVKCIENRTFEDCIWLEKVILPPNLESIEEEAFANCWKLKDINLHNNIKSIDETAFDGCINLPIESLKWPSSIEKKNDILDTIKNNPWLPSKIKKLREKITLKEGPGAQHKFRGKTQKGYGPEWWAISKQQLQHFKTHPAYNVLTMREFVSLVLESITDGLGIGYALLVNQEMPLKARIMISHAWDEPLHEFVENILASGEDGPYWICSTGIYQNNDEAKGVTIGEQIGPSPEHGPFATVLQVVDRMLAVVTTQCNIYTRLWCVYEFFIASKFGKPVTLRPFIDDEDLKNGWLYKDVCIANIKDKIDSETARCGNPNNPVMNDDEIGIRRMIDQSKNKFRSVDEAVELIRLIYLLHYPTGKIDYYVTSARDTIKDAIEIVLARLPLFRDQIMKYDNFVQEQLSIHHGFRIMQRPEDVDDYDYFEENYHCIVSDSSPDEEIDVFDAWMKYMIEIVEAEKKKIVG